MINEYKTLYFLLVVVEVVCLNLTAFFKMMKLGQLGRRFVTRGLRRHKSTTGRLHESGHHGKTPGVMRMLVSQLPEPERKNSREFVLSVGRIDGNGKGYSKAM